MRARPEELRTPRALYLLLSRVGREKARGESGGVGVVLIEQLLKLLEDLLPGTESVHVDPHGADQFEIIVVACIVLGRTGTRIPGDPKLVPKGLRELGQQWLPVKVLRDLRKSRYQLLNGHGSSPLCKASSA